MGEKEEEESDTQRKHPVFFMATALKTAECTAALGCTGGGGCQPHLTPGISSVNIPSLGISIILLPTPYHSFVTLPTALPAKIEGACRHKPRPESPQRVGWRPGQHQGRFPVPQLLSLHDLGQVTNFSVSAVLFVKLDNNSTYLLRLFLKILKRLYKTLRRAPRACEHLGTATGRH